MRLFRSVPYLCVSLLFGCLSADAPEPQALALAPAAQAPAPMPAAAVSADAPLAAATAEQPMNTESYDHLPETGFVAVADAPLSTFSVDVDTASYSNVRRMLAQGTPPPTGAVRIEELVNYFSYDYPQPAGDDPFAVYTEVAPAPWAPEHRLLHIGLQGRRIAPVAIPPRNLVFLIDVSGSMQGSAKLPLLKQSLAALIETLRPHDSVGIVVYAGASGVVLEPTAGDHKGRILDAIDDLAAGGSTNGGAGIELAYRLAQQARRPGSVNRVLLATDGDFNVGPSSHSALVELIEKKRETGVFLTVLGYGMGNYKDSTLERLADHGNGNYAYIDSLDEARKVLVEEGGANLVTIAKDVKIQLELNPARVGAYRLIGYENRRLTTRDFSDDRKDAGDIGAGHTVTALYELLSPAQAAALAPAERLKYQAPARVNPSAELATIKLRYKMPQGAISSLITRPVVDGEATATSDAFRFSAAVAAFGLLLRDSKYRGAASYAMVEALARDALGVDSNGHRGKFIELVRQARQVVPR